MYTKVNYSCTDETKSEPHKTLECRRGGRWIETDTTPWPTCSTHVETTTVCENCDSGKMPFIILNLIGDYNGQVL